MLCQLSGSKSSMVPAAMSMPSTNILVSNSLLQLKEPGLFGEMTDSKIEAGHVHNEPGVSGTTNMACSARKQQSTKKIK